MGKFRVGDTVVGNHPSRYRITSAGWVGVVERVHPDGTFRAGGFDLLNEEYFDPILTDSIKENKEKTMGIASKIKELTLSSDERLLRRVGLKNSDGEWTDEATEVLNNIFLDERKDELVAKAKEVEAEEKKAKKESK